MYFRWLSGCCLDIVSHSTRGNPARPSVRSFRATFVSHLPPWRTRENLGMAEPENKKNVTITKLCVYAMPQQSEDQEMQNKNAWTLNLKIESWKKQCQK